MIKRALLLLLALCALAAGSPAFAARTFTVGAYPYAGYITDSDITCDSFLAKQSPSVRANATCVGLDAALKATYNGGVGLWTFSGDIGTARGDAQATGTCDAGTAAGTFEIPAGYGDPATGHVTQVFPDPSPFSVKGCMVKVADTLQCYAKTEEAEVAAGVKKIYCTESFVENGDVGGTADTPSVAETPYSATSSDGSGSTGTGSTGTGGTGTGSTGTGSTGTGSTGTGSTGTGSTGTGSTGTGDTGTGTGSTGTGSTGSDFCALHPTLNVCINSSVTGTCSTVACTGDAIQCSILREAAEANCKKQADDDALAGSGAGKLGQSVLDGVDPDADKLPTVDNGDVVNLPSSLDQSGWMGGGECLSDKTFTIQGQTVTIPFSRACSALIALRYAVMIISLLVSFRTISGAVIRE